jgi:hypothetical protein
VRARGVLLVITGLGMSLLMGPAWAMPADVGPATNVPVPTRVDNPIRALPWCVDSAEWNCIESVEYMLDGEWRTAEVVALASWGGAVLETPGLSHEEGRTQVRAEAFERYDIDSDVHPAYQVQLQAWPFGNVKWDPPMYMCDASHQGNPIPGTDACTRAPWLADVPFRMTFRSSRLIPILAMTSVLEATTSYEEVDGGVRFALAGRTGPSQWTLGWGDAEKLDRFDGLTYEWAGLITDARGANGLGANCQGLGIVTARSNGGGSRMPEWNAQTGSLSFGVGGRHYSPDGSVYKGQADIFVPGQLARCLWKVDPRQTSRMEVEVFTENGEESVGTKSIGYDVDADLVKMIARDFTFSQKDIVARPTPLAASPGKAACDSTRTTCVTVDRTRKTAKVMLTKVKSASEVVGVALRGTEEDGRTQVRVAVRGGKAVLTVKLNGKIAQGQVWIVRTPSTFISSFQVG